MAWNIKRGVQFFLPKGSLNLVIPEMFNRESFDSGHFRHVQSGIYLCVPEDKYLPMTRRHDARRMDVRRHLWTRQLMFLRRTGTGDPAHMPFFVTLLIGVLFLASPSFAQWRVTGESNVYYTDDAALFSSTRRLSRNQDPTQPVIDSLLANQGGDVVFEPMAHLMKSFSLMGRPTELGIRGQGFVFTNNTRFNHGSLSVEASHNLTSTTALLMRYFFGPDLFLGKNEVRPLEESNGNPPQVKDEEVTTNYWAGGLAQQIPGVDDLRLILYGRYGLRDYDQPFRQRDTRFWTIGTHMEWAPTQKIGLALGYHYERGLADGRKQPELQDDTSYFNHFVTGEFEYEITERLSLEMGLHYEFNGWTTGIQGDERKGQHEDVIQGDIASRYRVNEILQITAGFQGSHRKESFEKGLKNLNTWLGAKLTF